MTLRLFVAKDGFQKWVQVTERNPLVVNIVDPYLLGREPEHRRFEQRRLRSAALGLADAQRERIIYVEEGGEHPEVLPEDPAAVRRLVSAVREALKKPMSIGAFQTLEKAIEEIGWDE